MDMEVKENSIQHGYTTLDLLVQCVIFILNIGSTTGCFLHWVGGFSNKRQIAVSCGKLSMDPLGDLEKYLPKYLVCLPDQD